jgi:hypothetical protein
MEIKRSWREQKIMLKLRFALLSDEDFNFNIDQKEKMLDNLALKLMKTRADLQLIFNELQTY